MIYLASPYSHSDPEVIRNRFLEAMTATSRLLQQGYHVYSPIAYGHQFADVVGGTFAGWKAFDFELSDAAKEVWILKLDGWQVSHGVTSEIAYAIRRGKTIRYLDPATLERER